MATSQTPVGCIYHSQQPITKLPVRCIIFHALPMNYLCDISKIIFEKQLSELLVFPSLRRQMDSKTHIISGHPVIALNMDTLDHFCHFEEKNVLK
jgi:hypothetical protein